MTIFITKRWLAAMRIGGGRDPPGAYLYGWERT